jgi:hypothetical protein
MRRTVAVFWLTLAVSGGQVLASQGTGGSAPKPSPGPGAMMCADCPMCQRMKTGQPGSAGGQGMQPGGMGMMAMMGGGTAGPQVVPGSVTVANDGTIYVLRGAVLYKYSAALKLLGKVALPTTAAPAGPAAGGHQGHH